MELPTDLQTYKTTFYQWEKLGGQEVDPLLTPIVETARSNAVGIMTDLDPSVCRSFRDMSITPSDKKQQLLSQLEEIVRLSNGLLDLEDEESQRQAIEAQYPTYADEDVLFAQAYSFVHGLTHSFILGFTSTASGKYIDEVTNSESAPDAPEVQEVELTPPTSYEDKVLQPSKPEYKGDTDLISVKEALYIIGTLVGRGDRVKSIREDGVNIPSEEDLQDLWYQLKEQLSPEEREDVEFLFSGERNEMKDGIVRAERQAAADKIIQIIKSDEIYQQYGYLLTNYDDDPRSWMLDFLAGISPSQILYMYELLSKVADPTVQIVNMAGRVVDQAILTTESEPSLPELQTEESEHLSIQDKRSENRDELIAHSITNVTGFYEILGLDQSKPLSSTELQRLNIITYAQISKAKSVRGLLSEGACRSGRKARFTLTDVIALAVYSANPHYFSKLEGVSREDQQAIRSTRPRELKKAISQAMCEHQAKNN
ncbi:MAG: hypothetical protein QG623_624 [Patescibacteria group bacterium]|nr:hypothetical protein [Patescibacteria group bacterium]